MAEDNKPRYQAFISPAGEAVFPWLHKPDTQFDAAGVYKVSLSLPFELAQDFIAKLESARNEFIATLPVAKQRALTPKPVYTMETTRPPKDATDAEKHAFVPEETGNVLFLAKMKAKVDLENGDSFTQSPVVVHADTGAAVEEPVYAGSVIRMKGQIVPYVNSSNATVGITLRLKAVQVIDLVTGDGSGAFWSDFEDEGESS